MNDSRFFLHVLADCIARGVITGLAVSIVLGLVTLLLVRPALATIRTAAANDSNSSAPYTEGSTRGLIFNPANGHIDAPILHTEVQLIVTGMIARAGVRQSFSNPTDDWQEAVYIFPFPESAAINQLRMQVVARHIAGEIGDLSKNYTAMPGAVLIALPAGWQYELTRCEVETLCVTRSSPLP